MNRRTPDERPADGQALSEAATNKVDSVALHGSLVRLAFRLLWNREDAEDAAQDALTRAHERRHELRDPQKWTFWVRQILIQRCRALGRRRLLWKRCRGTLSQREAEAEEEVCIDSSEAVRITRQLLMNLPERQRQVVVLRFLEGLDYADIGGLLNLAPATCRVHAYAALESLRAVAKRDYPDFLGSS